MVSNQQPSSSPQRSQIQSLLSEREAQQPEVANVEEEIAAIYTENQSLHKQQAALATEVRTLKHNAAQVTDDIAAEKCKLTNIQADCDRLRGQIVQVCVCVLWRGRYVHTCV